MSDIVHRLKGTKVGLILASASWLATGQIAQLASGFISAAIIARVLGPENFGLFSLITMAATLAASFIAFGSTQLIQIRIAVAPEKEAILVWSGVFIQCLGALVMAPLLIIALYFSVGDQIRPFVLLALAGSVIASAFEAFTTIYFARTLGRKVATNLIMRSVFSIVLRSGVSLVFRDVNILCLAILAEKSFSIAWLYLSLSRDQLIPRYEHPDRHLIRSILRDSWPVFVSMIAVAVYMRIDMFMIEAMLPARELGYYTAAARIAEAWYLVPSVICQSLLPSLAQVHNASEGRFREVLSLSYGLMFWMSAAAGLLMTVFAAPVLLLAFGEPYVAAASVLAITSWTGIFASFGGITRQATNLGQTQRILMWGTIVGALLNVGLNLLFIPWLGISGAAYATLISYAVPSWIAAACSRQTRPLFLLMTAAPLTVVNRAFQHLTSGRNQ